MGVFVAARLESRPGPLHPPALPWRQSSATPTKLKVTIDVNSADVERAMAAFVRADNNLDLVALTDPAAELIMSRYQLATFLLPRLARDVRA